MRLQSTHPPSSAAIEGHRRLGYWRAVQSPAAHIDEISSGGLRTALVDLDAQWTYLDLGAAVDEIGAALQQAGVSSDDAVLIIAPLRNTVAAAYLGTVFHGALAVLLDRRCGAADVATALRTTTPRVALAFDADARRLDLSSHCDVVSLDSIGTTSRADPPTRPADLDPDAAAVVLFTSGTTSAPKGVIHTINSLRCGAINMSTALDLTGDDAFSLSSPLASITGVLQLHAVLAVHAKIVFEERFSALTAAARIHEHHVTIIGGAPFITEAIFDQAADEHRPLPLRCIAVGGSMIPQSIIDKASASDVRVVRVYGSTEAPFSTASDIKSTASIRDEGLPMPGVEVEVRGARDELIVRGPHQFHGYLEPSHNDDAFVGDWIRTGDQADIAHGRIRIKGRLKEMVVRKGMKISLSEIDLAAATIGTSCAAFGVVDEETGERLALAVQCPDADSVTYDGVVRHLEAAGLAKWKLPEQIVLWDGALPRTASGKVDRRALGDSQHHKQVLLAPRLTAQAQPPG